MHARNSSVVAVPETFLATHVSVSARPLFSCRVGTFLKRSAFQRYLGKKGFLPGRTVRPGKRCFPSHWTDFSRVAGGTFAAYAAIPVGLRRHGRPRPHDEVQLERPAACGKGSWNSCHERKPKDRPLLVS